MACIELVTQDTRWTSVCCSESAGFFFCRQISSVVVHHISKILSLLRIRPMDSVCSFTLHAVTCFAFDILLWVKQLALMCHCVVAIKKISCACLCCHQRGAILKAKGDSVNHKRKIKFPSPSAQSPGIICTPAQSQPVGKLQILLPLLFLLATIWNQGCRQCCLSQCYLRTDYRHHDGTLGQIK